MWSLSQGGFGRGEKALVVEAQRDYGAGEVVTMDYGPSKLDADLLLNYGVLDDYVTRVSDTKLRSQLPPTCHRSPAATPPRRRACQFVGSSKSSFCSAEGIPGWRMRARGIGVHCRRASR